MPNDSKHSLSQATHGEKSNDGTTRRPSLHRIAASLGDDPGGIAAPRAAAMAQAGDAGRFPHPPYASREEAEAAYARHVSGGHRKNLAPLAINVHYGERKGARIRDAYTGRWYWDCHRVGSTFNLGHHHPEVVAALRAAMDRVDAGCFMQLSGYRAKVAEQLAASTEGKLTGVTFGVGGTCANEIAIHAARRHTGRQGLVAIAATSYHGSSDLALSISGISRSHRDHYLVDASRTTWVPFNDLEAMKAAITGDIAAVVMEPTPAQGGFPVPHPGYLEGVKKLCEARGALLVMDEVQTGLGGTGKVWAYQNFEFIPDILTTGKGFGGGVYPISAAIMEASVWHSYTDDQAVPHESTYAGSELGCVVASKVLELTTDPGFLARVNEVADRFADGFARAPFKLNQLGLCMGLHADDPLRSAARLAEAGVLVLPSFDAPVVPFRPILTLEDQEVDDIVERVLGAMA